MTWMHVFWDFVPGRNAEHIAENGLHPDEVQHVLMNPEKHEVSRTSGRDMVWIHAVGRLCRRSVRRVGRRNRLPGHRVSD